jgi:hypothetical protein
LRKMTSTVLLKRGENNGIAVYVPNGLFWRRWQPKLSKQSQNFFLDLVRELFDTPRTSPALHRTASHRRTYGKQNTRYSAWQSAEKRDRRYVHVLTQQYF